MVLQINPLIIIPAYNEEDSIYNLVDNIKINYKNFDYIIINDCSTDNTEKICRVNNFDYISLPINLGIGGAVQCGYRYAYENNYNIVIQLDGDGQHDPLFLNDLIKPIIDNESDMVIGSRFLSKEGFKSSKTRRLGIIIINKVIKICSGKTITDATSGFRSISRNLLKYYIKEYAQDYPEPESILTAILNGYKIKEISVIMYKRTSGQSSINNLRIFYYMIKVIIALILIRLFYKKINKKEKYE